MNNPQYILFLAMAIVPWGLFLDWQGLVVQGLGLAGIIGTVLVEKLR